MNYSFHTVPMNPDIIYLADKIKISKRNAQCSSAVCFDSPPVKTKHQNEMKLASTANIQICK